MSRLLIFLSALSIAACAAPTVYAPSEGRAQSGYREMRIEDDRYRVRFQGGSDVRFAEVEDQALRRAAELTLENGYEWFLVTGRRAEGDDRSPARVGVSASQSFGRWSGSGLGLGLSYDPTAGRKSISLEVVLRDGPMPDNPNAYEARSLLEAIPPLQ